MRTVQFDLPYGLEVNGELHKTVTLREVTGQDEISLGKDIRFQELSKKTFDIQADVMFEIENATRENRKPNLHGMTFDPVKYKSVEIATTEINTILFGKLVVRIGGIKDINNAVIAKLNKQDLMTIVIEHEKLNNPNGGDNKNPLPGETNG